MAHAVCTGRLQVGTGGRHRQLAQAVGHIPAHGRIAPFRRVAQAAKQIVKARKPQSCALFSSRNQPFCSQLPAILPPRTRTLLPQHILSPQRVTLPFPILLFSSQRSVLRYQSPLLPHPGQHPRYARTKTPILCSGRWEGGIGNRKSGLPANHRAHFKNANTS